MDSDLKTWTEASLYSFCNPKQWPTIPQNAFTENGYPVYGANGKIGFYNEFNHEKPTVLITCRGATCGAINVCEAKSYVTGNSMALDDLDEARVDLKFLVYALRNHGLGKAITGTAQPQITRESLTSVKVPLPPLNQQRRIAAIMDKADELRAKRRTAIAKLDRLTQSIFLDMFGDPIANTRSWDLRPLNDLGAVERGVSKHRPRNAPELLGGPYPFVQTGDVANCDGYIRTYSATYSDIGLRQSRLWPAGTLCITIAANIAKTGILTFDACFPDSVVGFRAEERATVEFVRLWLSFLQKNLEKKAPESAQKNINLEILRALEVPNPGIELQRKFTRRIDAIERCKIVGHRAIHEYNMLFASLQHRAFRGEL